MSAVPDFNDPAFQHDLYGNYRRLREAQPVHETRWGDQQRFCLLAYDDVAAAFRDDRFGSVTLAPLFEKLARSGHPDFEALGAVLAHIPVLMNPPDHTRLRALVRQAFTPRAVERLRGRIEAVVQELLDAADERGGGMDCIASFAAPLPVVVIAELVGADPKDRTRLKRWSDDFAPILDRTTDATRLAPAARAAATLREYFRGLVAERCSHPREDLVSALVAAREDGDALSEDELLAVCIFLLAAGHETTTNLIGNGVLALLRHPDALGQLRGRAEGIPAAVEELLRFESPVQRVVRRTRAPVTVRGVTIPEGVIVDLVVGAANRDPAQFERPDALVLARAPNRHLAFGLGRHFCLGASLARAETEVALRELLARFPGLRLAGDPPRWRSGSLLRGLPSLPVSF